MIKGLDKFRAHFEQNRDAFVLIGGVACHEWLASQGLPFRVTKDIDLVLIIEAVDQSFTNRLWAFIEAGGYEIREKAGNGRKGFSVAGTASSFEHTATIWARLLRRRRSLTRSLRAVSRLVHNSEAVKIS